MDTTTNTPSKGGVLPKDFRFFTSSKVEAEPKPGKRLTFEQRTIRTLLALERRRLRIDQMRADLAMREQDEARAHRHALVQLCGPAVATALRIAAEHAFTPASPPTSTPGDPKPDRGCAPHE